MSYILDEHKIFYMSLDKHSRCNLVDKKDNSGIRNDFIHIFLLVNKISATKIKDNNEYINC